MARAKKIELSVIVTKANDFFLNSADDQREARRMMFLFVQDILMGQKAYRGFSYLRDHHMAHSKVGKSIGVIIDPEGNGNHTYPDDSRIQLWEVL